jgi:hypothetical protein
MARSARMPKRFPVGTRYVVEGRSGQKGVFQVSARYLVLPSGRRLDLPTTKVAMNRLAPRGRSYRVARRHGEHPARLGV